MVFDALSFLYSLISLRVLWQLIRSWRAFWDAAVTPADRRLANEAAFFVLIPLGVFLHEAGHTLATWAFGGRVVDFQWRVFWGYIVPLGNFTPAQAWWISFSGPLVSILIGLLPIPVLPRLGQGVWGELLYAFVRHELFYALVWYPALSFVGFGGDWATIYDFSITPHAPITLVLHLALLYGLRRLDRSQRAARWRLGRDPQTWAAWQNLLAEAHRRPGAVEPLARLAHFCHHLGERSLRQQYLEEAERLDPNSPSLKAVQAVVAYDQRQYRRAQAAAEIALRGGLAPEARARLHRILARAHMELGQRAEAVGHLDAAIGLSPDEGDLYYWRGVVKRALGRAAEARADFEQAMHLAPDDESRARVQQELQYLR
jgi:hypothetical protein